MTIFGFTLILADQDFMSEDMAEAIYEAGADDTLCRSGDGIAAIDFDREAPSLEAAIRSAIADVKKAGFEVKRIELEPSSLAQPA